MSRLGPEWGKHNSSGGPCLQVPICTCMALRAKASLNIVPLALASSPPWLHQEAPATCLEITFDSSFFLTPIFSPPGGLFDSAVNLANASRFLHFHSYHTSPVFITPPLDHLWGSPGSILAFPQSIFHTADRNAIFIFTKVIYGHSVKRRIFYKLLIDNSRLLSRPSSVTFHASQRWELPAFSSCHHLYTANIWLLCFTYFLLNSKSEIRIISLIPPPITQSHRHVVITSF